MATKLLSFLYKPINASIVSLYRIVFGCFMVYQMIYYINIDYVVQFMTGPEFLFPYQDAEFLKPLSESTLDILNIGLLVSAILIALGFWYRYAMIYFFVVFTYFTFVDKTLYNNHLYLMSLISLVMIFMNADKMYSVKSYFSKKKISKTIPAWNQYILMFLIALPYFFGGIAKISPNWLDTNFTQIIIENSRGSFLNTLFSDSFLSGFITYGGIIYDLLIVFILLFKRTRVLGIILVLIFNLTNNFILFNDIGLFPFLMICSTIVFFDSEKVGNFISKLFKKKENNDDAIQPEIQSGNWTFSQKLTSIVLVLFVIFHLIMPFRYLMFTDNPEWTGIASRFSWRMKMQSKEITNFDVTMVDKLSKDVMEIDVTTFLTKNQLVHIAEDQYNLVYLAKYLKQKALKQYKDVDPIIHMDLKVKFNGLPSQNMFPYTTELTQIDEQNYTDDSWMLPLKMND